MKDRSPEYGDMYTVERAHLEREWLQDARDRQAALSKRQEEAEYDYLYAHFRERTEDLPEARRACVRAQLRADLAMAYLFWLQSLTDRKYPDDDEPECGAV